MEGGLLPVAISAISAVLGGGLLQGLIALYKAITESKETKIKAEQIGAKTPVEIESMAVATMSDALESASQRIKDLERERTDDKTYYLGVIGDLREQLARVNAELADMQVRVTTLLAQTQSHLEEKEV